MKVADLAGLPPGELLEVATRLALKVKELDAAEGDFRRRLSEAEQAIADLRAEVQMLSEELWQKELGRQALFMSLRRGESELHRLFGVKRFGK